MKRKLLFAVLAIPFLSMGQNSKNASEFGNYTVGGAQVFDKTVASTDVSDSTQKASTTSNANSASKRGIISYNFIKVGSTYYDLQTNASIGRRVILLPDGTVSVVWTTSEDQGFTKRGTGYNHFDGTNWLTVGNPTVRVESIRLGWPSIGLNGNSEWVMGHDAATGGFVMSKNASIGSTSWTQGSSILSEFGRRPIWGRVANSGQTFHCIGSYSDSTSPGDPRAPRVNGVYAPMTYSRSLDGGVTWDIQHILLPGYDSTRITTGGGDEYAIDVKDSIVAIVTGDHLKDVTLWKSTDNGTTFTRYICDTFKYAPYSSKSLMLDTPFVCDGSVEVLIDNNGKAHVFWGVSRILDEDTTDETYSFYPGTSLLGYWNENQMVSTFIAGGNQFDRNEDGALTISAGNTSALSNGTVPSTLKNQGISSVARLGNTSLLHSPSAGIDANGNIFVTFSFPLEQDLDANNVNLRDIMIVHSTDGGANWAQPQDITQIQGFEEEFGAIAKQVNGFVHLIFQKDETAGTNLQNNSASDNNHPVVLNDIMYAAVPVDKILDGSIETLWNLDVQTFNSNKEIFVVSQNYPNPFSNNSEVLIWLDASSDVTVEITDLSGKVISTVTYNELIAGNHYLALNAEGLSAGIYFYTVKTATHSVTRKMSVN
ncbi:MAG: T9SS type A sorting domain-containing protein [Bacteroidia bacterium]|nr:T9SS type A sorting domain-containing protein [Bacteroidia bacterium]